MPIDVEALLQPISVAAPAGADLRYQPITDQIKEARREDEDLNPGVWKHDLKTADYALVFKLSTEALSKRGKDLQIAAWLAEALLRREGFGGLRQGLDLVRKLLENFWDTVYPQMEEDGDLEMRATPLRWIGSQLVSGIRSVPLTQGGHNWYDYREMKAIPTEEEAKNDSAKLQKRNEALAGGAISPEEFEKGFETTPLAFSQLVYDNLIALSEFLRDFGEFCDEKFGDSSPDFSPLRNAIEEVQQTAKMLLIRKGGLQTPAPQPAQAPVELAIATPVAPLPQSVPAAAAAAPAAAPIAVSSGPEPASIDDATQRIIALSRYLRAQLPYSPISYLMIRALRWGELRATGGRPAAMFLEAPPAEVRVELKRLAAEGNWNDVRERAEDAMARNCGRAWLDLQRYSITACRTCGQDAIAQAVSSELKALIADFPQIVEWTLADDTPAANPETMQWLKENHLIPGGEPQNAEAPPVIEPTAWIPPAVIEPPAPRESADGEPAPPDAYELAMEAARGGRIHEALTILSDEIAREISGRGRFLRKVQLAQVCLATGNDEIARPILEGLAGEIEQRHLEAWEGSEVIAQPLALLYRTLLNSGDSDGTRRELYARICRLDPVRALGLGR
ncbi:MAG TPA: type VI secretion system protein TssA [Bryobacteraceae bacterium]|nr:type VI secretion system protein TssA [Bryobacteraceae bacterium]